MKTWRIIQSREFKRELNSVCLFSHLISFHDIGFTLLSPKPCLGFERFGYKMGLNPRNCQTRKNCPLANNQFFFSSIGGNFSINRAIF